jgi:hypothetical protein
MTKNIPHFDALRAYLNLLEKNISKRADVSLKEHLARLLISKLQDESVNNVSYRIAVDSLLESLPAHYKTGAVRVAREFFPFLVSDVRSVVTLMKTGSYRGFSGSNTAVADSNIKSMADLITISEAQIFSDQESVLYDRYLACLGSLGTEASDMTMRARISKALLYLTRDIDVTPVLYRSVTDSVLPILTSEEARQYFLSVSREFYYFLTESPDAPAMINAGAENNEQ